jgi:hypothetical protein
MRKPLRPGKRFAAGRRVVGKSSRVAEQTASGKRGQGSVLVPAAVKPVLETAGGRAAAKVGKRVRASVLGPAATKAALPTAGG